MAHEPELHPGADGEWVGYLQRLLTDAGFPPANATNQFDASTEHCVRAYQEASGCTVDGWVGSQTWTALSGGSTTSDTSSGRGEAYA